MRKEAISLFLIFTLVLILSLSFASAFSFSNFWNKITGNAVDVGNDGWTNWINRDGPSGVGDYETINDFNTYSGLKDTCPVVYDIQCQTTNGIAYKDTGQNVLCH